VQEAKSWKEFLSFTEKCAEQQAPGTFYVSHRDLTPNDTVFSDEDTAAMSGHQVLTLFLDTDNGAMTYQYHFIEPSGLEETQDMIDTISSYYPKQVIDTPEEL